MSSQEHSSSRKKRCSTPAGGTPPRQQRTGSPTGNHENTMVRDGRGESADNTSIRDSELSSIWLTGIEKIIKHCGGSRQVGVQLNSLSNIIPEFNPQVDNIEKWLHAIDEYVAIYEWNETTTVHFALTKLRGPAETWYRSLTTHVYSWVEWKRLLLETFPPKRDIHTMLLTMINYKPGDAQDLYEYSFQKLALINLLNLSFSDEDKVNLIMGAINDRQIRFSVETAGITNPTILAYHLKSYSNPSASSSISHQTDSTSSSSVIAPLPSTSHGRRCYLCNRYGHLRRTCPKNYSPSNFQRLKSNKQQRAIDYHVNIVADRHNSNAKFFKQVNLNKE